MRTLIFYALLGAVAVALVYVQRSSPESSTAETSAPEAPPPLAAGPAGPTAARYEPPSASLETVRSESAGRVHRRTIERFILEPGFGLARVIHIEPDTGAVELGDEKRYVARHRLIGAWAHDEPRLYASYLAGDHTEAPGHFEWQPLDATDRAALAAFGNGAELVMTPDRTRLVGALRAEAACVKCHDVPEGTLLGAFRYDLSAAVELVPTSRASGPRPGR